MARILAADGDQWSMCFAGWGALGAWMEENRGRYIGVEAKQMTGGIEHDDCGIDPRITRNSQRP